MSEIKSNNSRVAELEHALRLIAADSPPDDWEYHSTWDGYLGCDGIVDDVDESNMGDVHSHGIAVGQWFAAKIARAALKEQITPDWPRGQCRGCGESVQADHEFGGEWAHTNAVSCGPIEESRPAAPNTVISK